jgi:hypothetical protein
VLLLLLPPALLLLLHVLQRPRGSSDGRERQQLMPQVSMQRQLHLLLLLSLHLLLPR